MVPAELDGKRCFGAPDIGYNGWGAVDGKGGWGALGSGKSAEECQAACLKYVSCQWATLKNGKCSGFSQCSEYKSQTGFQTWKRVRAKDEENDNDDDNTTFDNDNNDDTTTFDNDNDDEDTTFDNDNDNDNDDDDDNTILDNNDNDDNTDIRQRQR